MQTLQALTLLTNVALFVPKMGCSSPYWRDLAPSDFFPFGSVEDPL
jgi:hypothetical protein